MHLPRPPPRAFVVVGAVPFFPFTSPQLTLRPPPLYVSTNDSYSARQRKAQQQQRAAEDLPVPLSVREQTNERFLRKDVSAARPKPSVHSAALWTSVFLASGAKHAGVQRPPLVALGDKRARRGFAPAQQYSQCAVGRRKTRHARLRVARASSLSYVSGSPAHPCRRCALFSARPIPDPFPKLARKPACNHSTRRRARAHRSIHTHAHVTCMTRLRAFFHQVRRQCQTRSCGR
ncbi:hypothetical protein MTO96_018118 [Rhipicephalus appendiculatus]